METIAFTSYVIGHSDFGSLLGLTIRSSLPVNESEPLEMARRYIDANRQSCVHPTTLPKLSDSQFSYKYHSNTSDHTFDTVSYRFHLDEIS